jgi:hypothetical protein
MDEFCRDVPPAARGSRISALKTQRSSQSLKPDRLTPEFRWAQPFLAMHQANLKPPNVETPEASCREILIRTFLCHK